MTKHLGSTVIAREWLDLRGPEDERPKDAGERISEEHLRAIIGRDSRSPDTSFKSAPEYVQACDDRHTLLSEVLSLRSRLRWVEVAECLPMDMCTVLVWIVGPESVTCEEPFVEIGAYNPERGNWQCYLYGEERDVEVSHWMALPPYPDVPSSKGSL